MTYPKAMESKCIAPDCGKNITYSFPLCREHFEEYGDKPEEWEPWMRFMWNEIQRRRRDTIKSQRHEVSLEYLEEEFPYL